MIDKPQIGVVYLYVPNIGRSVVVLCKDFRKGYVETVGVQDGKHRSISPKQLYNVK